MQLDVGQKSLEIAKEHFQRLVHLQTLQADAHVARSLQLTLTNRRELLLCTLLKC